MLDIRFANNKHCVVVKSFRGRLMVPVPVPVQLPLLLKTLHATWLNLGSFGVSSSWRTWSKSIYLLTSQQISLLESSDEYTDCHLYCKCAWLCANIWPLWPFKMTPIPLLLYASLTSQPTIQPANENWHNLANNQP